ncbi:MAG: response regulator transcription factor [Hyphomonadaceae bacterium JAD_PAG50586_4]|nr:MAG: response regulator transcription factor [Hyphomonadaceae bacterium JAD_PAG50586_4]
MMNATPTTPNELTRVLLVDDDDALRKLIGDFLRGQAFEVLEAASGATMRQVLAAHRVDVVILDVMMPGEDGLSLARELTATSDVAVILVSALGEETDRIVGLEVGADDYLPKPASPRELVARIRAVLRRRRAGEKQDGRVYEFEGWTFDVTRRVLRDPKSIVIALSQGEFALLRTFLERPQRVLSREQLLEYTRGEASEAFDRAIDTQTSRLRRKLASRSEVEIIRTIRNEGYMFVARVDRR